MAKKMAQMLHLAVVTDVVEVVGREVVHRDWGGRMRGKVGIPVRLHDAAPKMVKGIEGGREVEGKEDHLVER